MRDGTLRGMERTPQVQYSQRPGFNHTNLGTVHRPSYLGVSVLQAAERLAAFRGERLVFRDLEFGLEAGGALVLAGPNGSGKSTLLRLLAGLVRPAAGLLSWQGEDALADLPGHAARVAYVGHQDAREAGADRGGEPAVRGARCAAGAVHGGAGGAGPGAAG